MTLTTEIDALKRDMKIIGMIGKKRVVQYDLKTGKTIAVHLTYKDAAKAVGLKTTAGIYNTLSGRQSSSKGFGWREFK